MKIGLFGGSFNPIHLGHINFIKNVLKTKITDEVWIIPCKKHAFNKDLASEEDRLNMIKLAVKNIKKARISRIELNSRGKSYMIKTVKKFKNRFSHNFFLMAGSDITYEIKKWHKYKQLLREIEFIVQKRAGYKIKKVKGMKILLIPGKNPSNISSTFIRQSIKAGKSLKNLVPLAVERYINKNKLYK